MKYTNILLKIWFAVSKAVLDIWHKEYCTRVASRVAEWLKISEMKWNHWNEKKFISQTILKM